jgi:hypothetical protein
MLMTPLNQSHEMSKDPILKSIFDGPWVRASLLRVTQRLVGEGYCTKGHFKITDRVQDRLDA